MVIWGSSSLCKTLSLMLIALRLWTFNCFESVAYDRSKAPKECRVFGWLHPNSEKMALLREFTYDLVKSNVQTFNVSENGYAVNMIRFEFTSNHGNPTHTCIYRCRVHGHVPDPLSSWMLDIQPSTGCLLA